jgi:hypothetical protein
MNISDTASVKYLSVRQPWAQLIVEGIKPVENRPWSTLHRGPLLIHAGLTASATPLSVINARYGLALTPDEFERGGIIGVVTLTGVVRSHDSPFFDGPTTTTKESNIKPNYGLTFTRPQRLPFFPMRGALMIRPAPADAIAFYREALISYVESSGQDFNAGHERGGFRGRRIERQPRADRPEGETDPWLAPPTLMTCRYW